MMMMMMMMITTTQYLLMFLFMSHLCDSTKVEETKKLVAEQHLKARDFSAHEANSELAQQERLVEKHLLKRQVPVVSTVTCYM